MNRGDFIKDYWQYYLLLEKKFINSLNYVELNEDNYSTYSNEFAYQLLSIGSELDVVMKVLSEFSQGETKSINDYVDKILRNYPNITHQEVSINYKEIIIKPFENWNRSEPSKSLLFWKDYNSVKHGRVSNYKKASMKNVLFSLASLYILELYYLKNIAGAEEPDIPDSNQQSAIFSLINWETRYVSSDSAIIDISNAISID